MRHFEHFERSKESKTRGKRSAEASVLLFEDKKSYAMALLLMLKKKYASQLKTSLSHSNPFELLVATILSAQAQDAQVNKITPKLFSKYKSARDFAMAKPSELYKYLKSIGLYRSKARRIVLASREIVKRFNGSVPASIEELVTLHGVGRKTANVVLSNAFGINEGIAIDTHCITVSNRLGLAHSKDPIKIEKSLMKLFPRNEWGNVSHMLIALGRDTCTARAKHCERCVLKRICPSSTANVKR
ncbi:MAG: endonuclease III [Candidatus Micrarchaeia archaeon]